MAAATGQMKSGSLQWLTPEYALIGVIALLLAAFWFRRHGINLSLPAGIEAVKHPLAFLLHSEPASSNARRIQSLLASWAGIWLLAALAQPVQTGERLPDLPPERDILLLLDASITMTLEDYQIEGQAVSRMDMLKALLPDFLGKLQGERLGVIVFANDAHVWVPLTRDTALVQQQVQRLEPSLLGRLGAIGDALLLALQQAQQRAGRKQIVILITDADSATGTIAPEAAASLAAEAGIPVYALAMGSRAAASPIDRGGVGGLIYAPVNLPLLEAISRTTGGQAWQVDSAERLNLLLAELLKQQQNEAEGKPRFVQHPLYADCLLAALLPLILWQLWSLRREAGR